MFIALLQNQSQSQINSSDEKPPARGGFLKDTYGMISLAWTFLQSLQYCFSALYLA